MIALAGLGLSTTSCNRPAWEAGKAERMQKIDKKLCLIQKREASRPERLNRLEARIQKSRCYHAEHLESTRALVHREWESDKTRWCEECDKRREFARRQWCGKPDTIPATWAKIVY